MSAPQTLRSRRRTAQGRLRRALAAHHGLRRAEAARPDADGVVRRPSGWPSTVASPNRELMYDYEKTEEVGERAMLEFEPDVSVRCSWTAATGRALEAIDFKQLQWPGHGVARRPAVPVPRPRIHEGRRNTTTSSSTRPASTCRTTCRAWRRPSRASKSCRICPGLHYFRLVGGHPRRSPSLACAQRSRRSSRPPRRSNDGRPARLTSPSGWRRSASRCPYSTTAVSPYDMLADYFRGATGMMKDLYRNKDKLLQLLDKAAVFLVRQTIAGRQGFRAIPSSSSRSTGRPTLSCPASSSRTFWWPSFRKMMIGLIEAGMIPMPLWEADCTKRLEIIRDIPPGKCIYWFERTDMVKRLRGAGRCGRLARQYIAVATDYRETG